MSAVEEWPANVEAEASLLGAILIDNSIADDLSYSLSMEDFFEPIHAEIYSLTLERISHGEKVSPITLKPYFENDDRLRDLGGVTYLARLTADGGGLIMPGSLAAQIRELSERRRMLAGLRQGIADVNDFNVDMNQLRDMLDEVANGDNDEPSDCWLADAADELFEEFGKPVHGVTCPDIPALNRLLGTLVPGSVTIVGAATGCGKTATALSYAIGAARHNQGVLFNSLEMTRKEITGRAYCDLAFDDDAQGGFGHGVPYKAIVDRNPTMDDLLLIERARAEMRHLPFAITDRSSITPSSLRRAIRRHKRKMEAKGHTLQLVVVDYLQLMHPDGKGRSRYEDITAISMALKQIAKQMKVAIIALVQINRDYMKRDDPRPVLSDIRDSGQIEQDADCVLFLHRPEIALKAKKPDRDSPKYEQWRVDMAAAKGKIDFLMPKRRNGETGSDSGHFHATYQAVR